MTECLVVNAGSSSVKMMVFDAGLGAVATLAATGIGGEGALRVGRVARAMPLPDHAAALRACLDATGLAPGSLRFAAHRVVHGGAALVAPVLLTPQVEAAIAACAPLAPLHNPHNLAAIRALRLLAPDLPQYASFDTAFHATNPAVATRYALPPEAEALGLRRYGFHGISYAAMVAGLPDLTGLPLPKRLLALHLGNGASLCAILAGRSVATTMGWSPLDGLTMGTRAGSIDGNAVLRLAEAFGPARAAQMLNYESGLKGLGGMADMRALQAAGTPEARFAIAHFCYWAVRHAGSMIAAMGGLDAIAFTGGIGENDAHVRAEILAGLGWAGAKIDPAANLAGARALHDGASRVAIWTVPAAEERQIALDALRLAEGKA